MEDLDESLASDMMVEHQCREAIEVPSQLTLQRRWLSSVEVEAVHIGQEAQGTTPSSPLFTPPSPSLLTQEREEGRPAEVVPPPAAEGADPAGWLDMPVPTPRSTSPRPTSMSQEVSLLVGAEGRPTELSAPTVMVDGAPVGQSGRPLSPITSDSVGHMASGHSLGGVTMEDVIAFGGIPDPMSSDRRFSHRIQAQPDADDIQLGRAI